MSRSLLRLGGRVLATALFTGALFLGFVPPTAAGEFILWNGVFTADGECKVAAVDQSADILLFSPGTLPPPPADTCSGIMGAIQKAADRPTGAFDCEQQPAQSHIVPLPPLDLDDFDDLDDFLPEQLVGRVFRVGVSGFAKCEPKSTTPQ